MSDTTEDARSQRGVIIAFVVGAMILLGVSFISNMVQHQKPRVVPAIRIVNATSNAVSNPVVVAFVTSAKLQSDAAGWHADDLHPHALVDSAVIMPMGHDIRFVGGDTFHLVLPALSPGSHVVRMFWADAAHLGVGDSATTHILVAR
jgi:hypothetical protein